LEYDATKNISCGNMKWRIRWASNPLQKSITGDISVTINRKQRALPDAKKYVFDKFLSLDDVSATCNKIKGSNGVRSSLLMSGLELGSKKTALAQIHIEPNFETKWSFDAEE
jgi:hypothetical protein